MLGTGFIHIVRELRKADYYTIFDLLNSADFGVPQVRERLVFIGSRDGEPVYPPTPTHDKNAASDRPCWTTLRDGLRGLRCAKPTYPKFSPSKSKVMEMVPEGGNWRDLPAKIQREALGGAYDSWGGRGGFCRRLAWNRPAPALTTRPNSKATMLCHPTELRPLSVEEYRRLQQFPDEWEVCGGLSSQYRQLGNAVPVGLGEVVAEAIRKAIRAKRKRPTGIVSCAREDLLQRIAGRPDTILNPPRMQGNPSQASTKEWCDQRAGSRANILRHVMQESSVPWCSSSTRSSGRRSG